MDRLYLIDLSILAHKANALRQQDKTRWKKGQLPSWVRANLAVICGLAWDTETHPLDRPVIVFLCDSKPYWRSIELKKIGISYKKGRKTRTRQGLSYLKSVMIKEILAAGIPVLSLPGQEADDLASLFCRAKPETVAIRLVTTDNDWVGLVDSARSIDWYCAHGYPPRYRALLSHVQQSKQGKESGIKDLADFYQIKQRLGDSGDNVPPDSVSWATDILNPLPQHDPLKTQAGQDLVDQIYLNLETLRQKVQYLAISDRSAKRWMASKNLKPWVS